MKKETTARGFSLYPFKDLYGESCSLQMSSLATINAIWLGIDEAKPVIMASDASRMGIKSSNDAGWVPFLVPEEVLINTRMHLDRAMARDLIEVLQKFVDSGEI